MNSIQIIVINPELSPNISAKNSPFKSFGMHKYILEVYKYFSEKMKWKALFAAIIILGIIGLLFITDVGKKYTEFLRVRVGDFLNIISKQAKPEQVFKITLTAGKGPLYGQGYRVINSDFSGSGFYQYIKVGKQDIVIKSGKRVSIIINNFNGLFEYTSEGSIKLAGESNQIEIDDYVFSSEKSTNIDIEIVPFSFSLTNIEQDRISLQAISGNVKTDRGEAPLENSKLEINFFAGELSLAEDGSITLEGTAGSVIGDKFSFT